MFTYITRIAPGFGPSHTELIQIREGDDANRVWTFIHELTEHTLPMGLNFYGEQIDPLIVWADSEHAALQIGSHFLTVGRKDALFAPKLPAWVVELESEGAK